MTSRIVVTVISRRVLLRGGIAAGAGALLAVGSREAWDAYRETQPLPFYGGPESGIRPDLSVPHAGQDQVIWRGNAQGATRIALTFDDGPHPQWTPQVLATLAEHDVPATFFLKGVNVRDHGAIHRDSGKHELANHTWDHPDLARLDQPAVADQIARCTAAIEDTYGRSPRLFRPPYGHFGGSTVLACAEAGLPVVLWSMQFREADFVTHPDDIAAEVARQAHPGAIVLGHDCGAAERLVAIDRLGAIIEALKARDFSFDTVSALLA